MLEEPSPVTDRKRNAPAISVRGLGKHFGNRVAFDDLSFDVGYGEVFGFLGPNGAGKTTTVRTLGTLLAPTTGSATVAGLSLKPENGVEIRRRIAIMPESPGLYLRLSVGENLRCFADLYEVPDASASFVRLHVVNGRPSCCSRRTRSTTPRAQSCSPASGTVGQCVDEQPP